MKVIFLDIDGVLNTTASIAMGVCFIPEKVCMLNRLIVKHDVHIVISSTWRKLHDLEVLKEIMWCCGLKHKNRIIGTTPTGNHGFTCRGEEIQSVLDANKDIEKYAIIDDDSDFLEHQMQYHVHTPTTVGLVYRHIDQLEEMFS